MRPATVTLVAILAATTCSAQALVGHWEFASAADVIPNQAGQESALRHRGCEWVTTKAGPALRVPPKGGRVWCDRPAEALRPVETLSIIAWVRPLEQAGYRGILDRGRGWGDGNRGYRLLLYETGARFMVQGDAPVNVTGGATVLGQWHQIAATYDGTEAALFVDGEKARSLPLTGRVNYEGVESKFEVGVIEGNGLGGAIASLRIFDRALTEAQIAADFDANKALRLTPDELTAAKHERLDKCSLRSVPNGPFARDRHTTLLAHMDATDHADADYARWEGRAGGGRMKHNVRGRFGSGVELLGEGAPALYRGGPNCDMTSGTCEFWMATPSGEDPWSDADDRYLLTIIPEWHAGYGDRPSLHLCLRKHGPSQSLQLAAHTERLGWYSHLSGRTIADTARTVLDMPLGAISSPGWHHVLCSWTLGGSGRLWLLVDGEGVTAELKLEPSTFPAIPCYKIFFGGSYFPEVYCPTARAVFDEFRLLDIPVGSRLAGREARGAPRGIDEDLMMRAEDGCRALLDLTATIQMGGGWEGVYTWPNLMPDESPGSYAAVAEDEYSMRYIAPAFLRAYEVFGDDRYLRVAEQCGQMLVTTQDENGAWCQGYVVMPDGYHPVSPGGGSIEEGTQTDPLRVLFWLWRLTRRPEYRDAAAKSAAFVRAAQKPDGSWSLTFDSRSMRPGGGYTGMSTLNDGTTTWGMKAMLMGWHLTEDREYLDALTRAGEWLLRAALRGKAVGWAEQYGDDGKPAWARAFEPPAICISAISYAAEALFLLYDLTGDSTYLAPVRECVDWGQSLPTEKSTFRYYDPDSGEPVAARDHKLLRYGEAGFREAARYPVSPDYFDRLDARLTAREEHGPLIWSTWPEQQVWRTMSTRQAFDREPVTDRRLAARIAADAEDVAKAVGALNAFAGGTFPAAAFANVAPRHGRYFWPGKAAIAMLPVLDHVQHSQVLAGERDIAGVPRMTDRYLGLIDPKRDWYRTPLLEGRP